MSMLAPAIALVERAPLPDAVTAAGVDFLCGKRRRALYRDRPDDAGFAAWMAQRPLAEHVDAANAQHYELPPRFFALSLGRHAKYSCCLYPTGTETLDAAEQAALEATVVHAGLADGQDILELGCGWGSLSLFMAARFPAARITAVSNSRPQGDHIRAMAAQRGITNLTVLTADMNTFVAPDRYDRVVSVEMFEHMANWRLLLGRVRDWLRPDGRLFLHVFSHERHPYRFDTADKSSWIAQYFFTGGIMPAHDYLPSFDEHLQCEAEWIQSGKHYQQTAEAWLANTDAAKRDILPLLQQTYGNANANVWLQRWRIFFMSCEELWGLDAGEEWGVTHYLLTKRRVAASTEAAAQ